METKLTAAHTFKGAHRRAIVPGVGLPLLWALALFGCALLTIMLVSNWRYWILLFALWTGIWLFLREKLRRDHNGMRVAMQGLRTKAPARDAHIWKGVTVKSLPVRPQRRMLRGVRA